MPKKGFIMTKEHRDKISAAKKGVKLNIKHDKQFKKGNKAWNKGVGEKLNDALSRWRDNGGVAWNKGLKGLDNPLTGRKISEETRAKMKAAAKKRGEKIRKYTFIADRDKNGHGKIECICIDCKLPTPKRPCQLKKWSGRCLDCAKKYRSENAKGRQPNKKISTTCTHCGKVYFKTKDKVKKDKGRCRDCFYKTAFSSPIEKEKCRKNLAKQRGLHPDKYTPTPQTGEKHWNWQGGKTGENERVRQSLKYKQWRTEVFKRDDYTCQFCGERGGKLHADHILPFAEYPDLRTELSNGRTLCIDCHKTTDTYGFKKKKVA